MKGFSDIHIADKKAYNRLLECQENSHKDSGCGELASAEHEAANMYKSTHEGIFLF